MLHFRNKLLHALLDLFDVGYNFYAAPLKVEKLILWIQNDDTGDTGETCILDC